MRDERITELLNRWEMAIDTSIRCAQNVLENRGEVTERERGRITALIHCWATLTAMTELEEGEGWMDRSMDLIYEKTPANLMW